MDFTGMQTLLGETTSTLSSGATIIQGSWPWLVLGVILIIATIALLYFLKQVLVNSIVGIAAWVIITYIFPLAGLKLALPFIPSLAVSAIFGLAGIGAMLVLAFMGVI